MSIIIVNWNSSALLRDCLGSLASGIGTLLYEVIVIDSGSFDGSEKIAGDAPIPVTFLQCADNVGFAQANNIAYEHSSGQFILFLNPDTIVAPGAIEVMYSDITALSDAGILGANLFNEDGTVQTTSVRAFPNLLNQILESNTLRKMFPRSRLWGTAALYDNRGAPIRSDAVSGACLMIRRRVFEAIGLFTTDYFMYSEDIDLCLKATSLGWATYFSPQAHVIHLGGKSSSKSDVGGFASVMPLESRWRYFRRHRNVRYATAYRLSMLLIGALRLSSIAMAWPFAWILDRTAILRISRDKWIARTRWTIGRERWVQQWPKSHTGRERLSSDTYYEGNVQ